MTFSGGLNGDALLQKFLQNYAGKGVEFFFFRELLFSKDDDVFVHFRRLMLHLTIPDIYF